LFSVVTLPPFLLACGFLLSRYLSAPPDPPVRRAALLMLEGASWILIGVFLFLVSGINLATPLERAGAACTAFLVASFGCLPVALLRRTSLEQRLGRLPRAAGVTLLLSILVASIALTVVYLKTPAAFI
jgi:hypothetical protein